jgi:hypothetical protein
VASYHLYYLRDNRLIGAENIEAADDTQAVHIAKRRGDGQAVEIWNGHRRIRIVAPARASR